ncbi:hypothetical protein IQ251_12645 [Saccharopolyspora sp. HNM0983]|uniref:Cas10/Cmr2 second palm domain-containing protein n=1 Tax=Saccharopolyspora montiporae TaxID=2781240 RepID=A0A929G223_9PSEU|nr:hypothetical protein [Saccharopolyspora sp. HNM0983]MBE9375293.1 hypothetical protein [Saccharopolyspora sp. HNM0983]
MTDFLDIAVVRIQRWLSRAPHLRGRRGASTLIRKATAAGEVAPLLVGWEEVAERCTEAGQIDGVIPLRLNTDDEERIAQLEKQLVAHLRALMPAASFESKRRSGTSWLDAQLRTPVRTEWPAPTAEWPLGKRCDWCAEWSANEQVPVGSDGKKALCIDCRQRTAHAGYATSGHADLQPGTERDLLDRWTERFPDRPMRVPDDFPELARLGETDDATHLATIHADGNAIGQFRYETHRALRKDARLDFDLPGAIQHATWSALLDGLQAATDPDADILPVIAHLVGGDDVLLSLPAHRAWTFVVELQRGFSNYLTESLTAAGLTKVPAPSISAAIAFHHYTHPLSANADLADELLSAAKKEHFGSAPALAWHDRTHEGPQPSGRPSIRLDQVGAHWAELNALAGLPQSTRKNLAAIARTEDGQRLADQIKRLGLTEVVHRQVTDLLNRENPLNLANELGMVRWWRGDAR